MSNKVLNKYRIMWLMVLFDLPTETSEERKMAASFRKSLLEDGFDMMQYSVYIRHCPSKEYMELHQKRIQGFSPLSGKISILHITDKQFGDIINIWGKGNKKKEIQTWKQIVLF